MKTKIEKLEAVLQPPDLTVHVFLIDGEKIIYGGKEITRQEKEEICSQGGRAVEFTKTIRVGPDDEEGPY